MMLKNNATLFVHAIRCAWRIILSWQRRKTKIMKKIIFKLHNFVELKTRPYMAWFYFKYYDIN